MIIAVRKYKGIDMGIERTFIEVWTEATKHAVPREELEQPPYNWTFLDVPDQYIKDIRGEDFNDDLTFSPEKYNQRKLDEEADRLRELRDWQCFDIVNRGQVWYNRLTQEQKLELDIWYQKWLDVTKTRVVPTPPDWLKVPATDEISPFDAFRQSFN